MTIKKLQLVKRMIIQLVATTYPYFSEHYKLIAIDLSKQQVLDADLKLIKQINFTRNLDWDGSTTMFFITEEIKETKLNLKELGIYFEFF